MMWMQKALLAILMCSAPLTPSIAMEALNDVALSSVAGADGVSLRIELMINSDSAGAPMDGGPGEEIDCSAVSGPCRFAVELDGRPDKWLVFKGFSGILRINDILLDAEPALSNAGSNSAYFDASKFEKDGVCLLSGGTCTAAALGALPALKVSFPATVLSYDSATNTSTGFTSLEIGVQLDGIVAEQGVGAAGYNANVNNPFLGFNVRDVNGASAGIAIGGAAYVFGF